MNTQSIPSSLDLVNWFYKKTEGRNFVLDEPKTQHLLFLAQYLFVSKFKRLLYPSLSVCSKEGFYDPSIRTILDFGLPLMPSPKFSPEIQQFLELVWDTYAKKTTQELLSLVCALDCWKKSYRPEEETIVNLLSFGDSKTTAGEDKPSLSKPKIMFSQNGPVKVSAWQPRKLSSSNK